MYWVNYLDLNGDQQRAEFTSREDAIIFIEEIVSRMYVLTKYDIPGY